LWGIPWLALGVVILGTLWLLERRRSSLQKAGRRLFGTWRQSDYYRRFVTGLDAASRLKFLALGESDQYNQYLDWTLREGLRGRGSER